MCVDIYTHKHIYVFCACIYKTSVFYISDMKIHVYKYLWFVYFLTTDILFSKNTRSTEAVTMQCMTSALRELVLPLKKRHLFLFIKTYHFSDIVCTYIFRYFMNYDYTLQFKQRFNFWHFLWYFSQGCFMLSNESAHWSYSTAWPVVMSRPSLVLKSALNSHDNVTDKHSSEWIFFRAEFVYFS